MSFIAKLLTLGRAPKIESCAENLRTIKRARIAALLRDIAEPVTSRS